MKFIDTLAHLFIPRSSNDQKAKILHVSSLSLIIAVFILLQTFIEIIPSVSPQVLGYAANISPEEVVRLTNEKRVAEGLSPLSINQNLSQAALAKGNHMINNDYWAHVAPDGTEPWKFFGNVGYKYKFAGENLARDFQNASTTVDAWMASPSHKENMLSPKYREIGVAVVEGDLSGADTTIVVQLFGTKLSDSALVTGPVAAAAAPTPVPTAPPVEISAGLSQSQNGVKVLISPFNITKGVSLGLIAVLLTVLVIDGVIISKRGITRVGARTLAHISFLGMILAILLIAKGGNIL